jgi:predicted GNAT family acetyltransferase
MAIDITDVPRSSRFELRRSGQLIGWLDYHVSSGVFSLRHTEVAPQARHDGLATRLVHAALDDLALRGATVIPVCGFVRWIIEKDPEYRPLVAGETPAAMCPWLGVSHDAE